MNFCIIHRKSMIFVWDHVCIPLSETVNDPPNDSNEIGHKCVIMILCWRKSANEFGETNTSLKHHISSFDFMIGRIFLILSIYICNLYIFSRSFHLLLLHLLHVWRHAALDDLRRAAAAARNSLANVSDLFSFSTNSLQYGLSSSSGTSSSFPLLQCNSSSPNNCSQCRPIPLHRML